MFNFGFLVKKMRKNVVSLFIFILKTKKIKDF